MCYPVSNKLSTGSTKLQNQTFVSIERWIMCLVFIKSTKRPGGDLILNYSAQLNESTFPNQCIQRAWCIFIQNALSVVFA